MKTFSLAQMPWKTRDPFLFCVHHLDRYPTGAPDLGPTASLTGRDLGQDFSNREGWSMYHGRQIPGFPPHPHRGFETITVVRRGVIDHSDSLGATARFGDGDVQWMTAGRGIVHAEMFPLLNSADENVNDFFQIWLNLPAADKMVEPHFKMLWSEEVPKIRERDEAGREVVLTLSAGTYAEYTAPSPPPNSWASNPDAHIRIMVAKLGPGARWVLPAAVSPKIDRNVYFFSGRSATVSGVTLNEKTGVELGDDRAIELVADESGAQFLIMEGLPIAEPVAHYGPFVMNSQDELAQAVRDYRNTQFGGWPWDTQEPVHERNAGRFAKHADGKIESRD
ncbi:MAG: pirin family protein [Myxococcota bacterium]